MNYNSHREILYARSNNGTIVSDSFWISSMNLDRYFCFSNSLLNSSSFLNISYLSFKKFKYSKKHSMLSYLFLACSQTVNIVCKQFYSESLNPSPSTNVTSMNPYIVVHNLRTLRYCLRIGLVVCLLL